LVYGPSLLQRGEEATAPALSAPTVAASAPALPEPDDSLAPLLAVPSERSAAAVLNGPDGVQAAAPVAKPSVASSAQPAGAPAKPLASTTLGSTPGTLRPAVPGVGVGQAPGVAGPAAEPALIPVPVADAREIEPGDKLPPPAPALPAALGGALAPPEPSEPAAAAQGSRLERARACLAHGDLACATELLQNAGTEAELELWIETLRAQGDGLEARRAMKRFVEAYPEGRRAAIYRRILSNTQ
jgi:hypothetical protein